MNLNRVAKLHTLLTVLGKPGMRCTGGAARSVSRLFLDCGFDFPVEKTVGWAKALGLVWVDHKLYAAWGGEDFIGLTARGAACVDGEGSGL